METKHSFATTTFLAISLFLLSSSSHLLRVQASVELLRNFTRIALPGPIGPETIAFDAAGGGPYTGVSDGRVLKWEGDKKAWIEFATTSHKRNKTECNGTDDPKLEDMCGRPLGLGFNKATGDLYIADAYFGLLAVGRGGGLATKIAISAEGVPFRFTNSLDIDQATGFVYFTETSTVYQRRDFIWAILNKDKTGRLMKYDPKSKQVTVLLRGLFFANGVVISKDKTFILVVETTTYRILRYWLQGPKKGTHEVFAQLPGYPDNINRNSRGEFWVALNHGGKYTNKLKRKAVFTSISKFNSLQPLSVDYSIAGVKLNEEGTVMKVLYVNDGTIADFVSEVKEQNESLWIGSVVLPFVGVSKL